MGPKLCPLQRASNSLAVGPIDFFVARVTSGRFRSHQTHFWIGTQLLPEPIFFPHVLRMQPKPLHLFFATFLTPSLWIRVVYPSLHVSSFNSPVSTFIWPLAFVHPPPGPQVWFVLSSHGQVILDGRIEAFYEYYLSCLFKHVRHDYNVFIFNHRSDTTTVPTVGICETKKWGPTGC